jgi:NAD(P)-dependent dehydrogenase (short-subunit alcohol dehydrogenase family)
MRTVAIVGAGGVLGDALVREFVSKGDHVITLRRANSRTEHDQYPCALDQPEAVESCLHKIAAREPIELLIHNSAHLETAPFLELTAESFELAWRVCVGAAAAAARAVLPGMLRRQSGAILFSGATASVRGSQNFAAFASAKFALRGMAQSLAREYQPRGIHVAHVIIDGLLKGSPSIKRFGGSEETALHPESVARVYRSSPGIERIMLERIGDEVALATSIVRYGAGTAFPRHVHERGEEFLVLEGTFSDENGDYTAGSYVRNPPHSHHAPSSKMGCVIFVKLRHMAPEDGRRVVMRPTDLRWQQIDTKVDEAVLHCHGWITISILRLGHGAELPERHTLGGEELFVVSGSIAVPALNEMNLNSWSWLRSADDKQPKVTAPLGAVLWRSRGHLTPT